MVKNEYLDEILDFLSLTHPSLLKADGSCVEIRPIIRDGVYDYQRSKSLNLFNLNEKSIERLNDFLNFHQGQRTCIYYSIFAYDYDKEAFTKTGKKAVKGKITSEAALFTEEIVLDFDDINEEEFDKLLIRFVQLDLDALWVFTGHGINEKVQPFTAYWSQGSLGAEMMSSHFSLIKVENGEHVKKLNSSSIGKNDTFST